VATTHQLTITITITHGIHILTMDSSMVMEEETMSPSDVVPIIPKMYEMSGLVNTTRIFHVAHITDHTCGCNVARILDQPTIMVMEQDKEIKDLLRNPGRGYQG
jgi:hypothetical protein